MAALREYLSPDDGVILEESVTAQMLTPFGEILNETMGAAGQPIAKRLGGIPFATQLRGVW